MQVRGFFPARVRAAMWVVTAAVGLAVVARADDSFKMIHQPGGGEMVYGPVTGQTTMPGAMGAMLRKVHGQFGERPQVSRFFRTKGSDDSVATFFTVNAKSQGNKPMAGLVLVAMTAGQQPTGALLYDDAKHFHASMGPMMKKLNEVWAHSGGTSSGAAAVGHAKPLHVTAFPDNSGSIGLPDGWQITSARQGTMHASGPNGESAHIGVYVPVLDPSNPQQGPMIQRETRGGQLPLPGMYVAIPYGTEPFRTLQEIDRQLRAKRHQSPPAMELIDAQDLGNHCTHFKVHIDQHDGTGRMFSSINMCVFPPFMPGHYTVSLNQATLPDRLIDEDKPTFQAMFQSYKTNDTVIEGESQAQITQIHEIGRRAQMQADASHEAWDIHQQAYHNQQDSQDKRYAAFDNYILDQSVIRDTQENAHGTFYNADAEAIVKSNPNRYEYVPTQDYVKGIDY